MTVGNSRPRFSVALQSDAYQKLINDTLGDKAKAQRFIASISSSVATTPALQNCDAGSILSGALVGEALNLSPSPQLGHYYLVPYGGKAQFQLGYKGYLQLAIRSGQYQKINVLAIKEGELIRYDALNEEIEVNMIDDEREREKANTIGYYAMFELANGFKKSLYWSKEKMEEHANKYSQGYRARKGHTFWEKDFDGMAFKTLIRQLISKWGIMSLEMQQAQIFDMGVIDENKNVTYVDNADRVNSDDIIEQDIETEVVEAEVVEL